jgi:hypothetical protein
MKALAKPQRFRDFWAKLSPEIVCVDGIGAPTQKPKGQKVRDGKNHRQFRPSTEARIITIEA